MLHVHIYIYTNVEGAGLDLLPTTSSNLRKGPGKVPVLLQAISLEEVKGFKELNKLQLPVLGLVHMLQGSGCLGQVLWASMGL